MQALHEALRQAGPERDALLLLVKAAIATVLAWQFAVRVLDSPVRTHRWPPSSWSAARWRAPVGTPSPSPPSSWGSGRPVRRDGLRRLGVDVFGGHPRRPRHRPVVAARGPRHPVPAWCCCPHHRQGHNAQFTYLTILETIAGGVIGVATNAIVFAPLHLTKPRQRVSALARRVRELLDEMASGLRGGWDAETAGRGYRRGTEIADKAPYVLEDVRRTREPALQPPRQHPSRRRGLEGYEHTVTTRAGRCGRYGIARTLVDAADERRHQPPVPAPPDGVCHALAGLAVAVSQFGRHDEEATTAFDDGVARAFDVLTKLREEVRTAPSDDPANGRLRLAHERLPACAGRARAARSGRRPHGHRGPAPGPAESPVWARLASAGRPQRVTTTA